jgi:hypothetical protein
MVLKELSEVPAGEWFVYMYVFPNGKRYIGQSHAGAIRYGMQCAYGTQIVRRAMRKYTGFKKYIIWHGSKDHVDEEERHFIKLFLTMQKDYGYNCESGGNNQKILSKETREKISENRKGIIPVVPPDTKARIIASIKGNKYSCDKVICVETGKIYDSITYAAADTGIKRENIRKVLKGLRHTAGGYHWEDEG